MDVQGAEVARPYVEAAKAEYTNLVDTENVLADRLGLRVVPNIHLIDESGMFRGKVADRAAVEAWLRTEAIAPTGTVVVDAEDAEGHVKALEALTAWMPGNARLHLELADSYRSCGRLKDAESSYEGALKAGEFALIHFRLSSLLLDQGRRAEAVEHLRRAARLEPDNYVIRKQAWAVETPDAFYSGPVNYGWQKQQMERESRER